jgi:hypothetical protein
VQSGRKYQYLGASAASHFRLYCAVKAGRQSVNIRTPRRSDRPTSQSYCDLDLVCSVAPYIANRTVVIPVKPFSGKVGSLRGTNSSLVSVAYRLLDVRFVKVRLALGQGVLRVRECLLVGTIPQRLRTKLPVNPLTPELNLSAQRCLTRFFTGDFAS